MLSRRHAVSRFIAAPLLALGLLAACAPSEPAFKSTDITGADYGKNFALTDHHGQPRTLADFKGKVVTIFFGYTQCPDVCPTALSGMSAVMEELGPEGDRVQVIFVTVDPERDTPEMLKGYMASFDPSFIALRGTPEQLVAVAKDFKIYFKRVDGQTPTSYTMDHSAGSYVYDTKGRLRVYHRYGAGAQSLAADVRALLDEGR